MNGFVAFLEENPWIVAVILIVAGGLSNFFGSKFISWVVAFFTGGATFLCVMLLCSVFGLLDYIDPTQEGGNVGEVILSFVLAIGLGVLVGFLMKRYFLIGFSVLGFIAGFFAGNLLYNLVLITFLKSTIALFIISFTLGLVGAYLCYKRKNELAIITTALLGSYAFVRGISMFAGGYPNEITLYEQINNGTATYTPIFLAYLAGMGIMFVIGVIFQMKHKSDDDTDHFQKHH